MHIQSGDFMKILVVFTGGTIGSCVTDGWISPDDSMKYLLIEKYREITGDDTPFDTLNPYTILSENLSAENLNVLIRCVRENADKYDGIIVTHGSDTLQYSASALAYTIGCECTPVMLVASNYPIEDERANGIFNFTAAVEFIKSQKGKGVYISYKNKNEPTQIHTATRTVCHKEADDEVFSIDSEPFACFDKKIILNENYQTSSYSEPVKNAVFSKNSGILSVSVLPGEAYNYDLSDYKAVIFRPFHSGTISTSSEELRNFCKRAKEQNVPIFVINAPDGITYASSKEYNELGINVLPMCSFPAIYIKLWLLASNNNLSAETVIKTVACEFLKTKNGDVTYAY